MLAGLRLLCLQILYYDGQFDDARLNVALATTAAAAGAAVANYVEATQLIRVNWGWQLANRGFRPLLQPLDRRGAVGGCSECRVAAILQLCMLALASWRHVSRLCAHPQCWIGSDILVAGGCMCWARLVMCAVCWCCHLPPCGVTCTEPNLLQGSTSACSSRDSCYIQLRYHPLTSAVFMSRSALFLQDANGQVIGAQCRDTITGRKFEVHAKVVINAAGKQSTSFQRAGLQA